MHVLIVAIHFPSPQDPYRGSFIGEQVRLLSECKQITRLTILAPTSAAPTFMRKFQSRTTQALPPLRHRVLGERCEVFSPHYLKAPRNLFLRWTIAQWCRLVDRIIVRFHQTCPVSLIHAHIGSVSAWSAIHAAQRHHLPCAVTYHGSEVNTTLAHHHKGWQLCRDSFRYADLNLPVSRALERILRQHAQPLGRCETLLLGVDQTRFFPAAELTSAPRVLFVGRIERAKGSFDLLSAWARVRQSCPEAELILVGQDHTDGLFAARARSLGIDASLTLTGPLPAPEVADLMRQARIFCLPSYQEGMPVSLMEALSCGLAVVATRVGGIPDIIDQERTGLLVEPGDVNGIANALLTLLHDPNRCIRMGRSAAVFASMHLDARKTVKRLVELYAELIAAHSDTKLS